MHTRSMHVHTQVMWACASVHTHTGCTQSHTNAFQDTHAQELELRKSHGPCLSSWGSPLHGWSRLPPPPPLHKGHSTQDNDGGAHTQVSGLSGCEGKQGGASREKWSGGAPPPPLPSQGSLYSQIKPHRFIGTTETRPHACPQPLPCLTVARESVLWFSFFVFFLKLF